MPAFTWYQRAEWAVSGRCLVCWLEIWECQNVFDVLLQRMWWLAFFFNLAAECALKALCAFVKGTAGRDQWNGGRRRRNSGCFLSVHASLRCSSPPPSGLRARARARVCRRERVCVRLEALRDWVSRLMQLTRTGDFLVISGEKHRLDLSTLLLSRSSGICQTGTKRRESWTVEEWAGACWTGKCCSSRRRSARGGQCTFCQGNGWVLSMQVNENTGWETYWHTGDFALDCMNAAQTWRCV